MDESAQFDEEAKRNFSSGYLASSTPVRSVTQQPMEVDTDSTVDVGDECSDREVFRHRNRNVFDSSSSVHAMHRWYDKNLISDDESGGSDGETKAPITHQPAAVRDASRFMASDRSRSFLDRVRSSTAPRRLLPVDDDDSSPLLPLRRSPLTDFRSPAWAKQSTSVQPIDVSKPQFSTMRETVVITDDSDSDDGSDSAKSDDSSVHVHSTVPESDLSQSTDGHLQVTSGSAEIVPASDEEEDDEQQSKSEGLPESELDDDVERIGYTAQPSAPQLSLCSTEADTTGHVFTGDHIRHIEEQKRRVPTEKTIEEPEITQPESEDSSESVPEINTSNIRREEQPGVASPGLGSTKPHGKDRVHAGNDILDVDYQKPRSSTERGTDQLAATSSSPMVSLVNFVPEPLCSSTPSEEESKKKYAGGSAAVGKDGHDAKSSTGVDVHTQRAVLEAKLKKLETASTFALHLPDKGAKLQKVIIETKEQLKNLGTSKVTALDEQKKMLRPEYKTREEIKADLISQYQKALALNPSKNSLYAGRMTDKRFTYAKTVTQESLVTLHSAITQRPPDDEESPDPSGLVKPLMTHQRQALTWTSWREDQKPPGGILADDMGLGKTLTMISLMLRQRSQKAALPESVYEKLTASERLRHSNATLVVCPASIIHQWAKEIEKFTKRGYLRTYLFHGAGRERNSQRLASFDVVLTTYGIVTSEIGGEDEQEEKLPGLHRSVLLGVAWRRLILDEAHTIKNYKTKVAKACCRIPAQSRWALTGTPVHNDLKDLYSLIKFIRCEPFDQIGVWQSMIENKSEQARQRLNTLVNSLILRRTKNDIVKATGKPLVNLPPKLDETVELTLTPEERAVYDRLFLASKCFVQQFVKTQEERDNELALIASGRATQEQLGYRNPFNRHAFSGGAPATQLSVLVVILRLRQACVHFSLTKDDVDLEALRKERSDDVAERLHDLSLQETDVVSINPVGRLFERSYLSTKLKALMEKIDAIAEQQSTHPSKIVIVSQWVKLLELIAIHLKQRRITFTSITGSLSVAERGERVEKFNRLDSGPLIMLLSLSAGGVGLNLIGGNHLFIVDLHWNPALEKQACDRIYRVGQTRNVWIHKFVCKDTIETKVLDLQKQKLALAHNVLTGAGMKGFNKLTMRDLAFMFSLGVQEPMKIPGPRAW